MKKNGIKLLSILIIFFLIAVYSSPLLSQSTQNKRNVNVILKNCEGECIQTVNTSYDEISIFINQMKDLIGEIENKTISEKEFIESFLSLLIKENLISNKITFNYLQKLANVLSNNMKIRNLIHDNVINTDDFFESNNGIPFHMGRSTIIASISFGNYLVKRIIPFGKYDFYEVFSKNLFLDYNISSVFSYASACIWTPGPHGNHILYSFMHYPGLERLSHKVFIDKAIGGIFIVGANISLEAYSTEGDEVLFDATIGVYGSDVMIGFN